MLGGRKFRAKILGIAIPKRPVSPARGAPPSKFAKQRLRRAQRHPQGSPAVAIVGRTCSAAISCPRSCPARKFHQAFERMPIGAETVIVDQAQSLDQPRAVRLNTSAQELVCLLLKESAGLVYFTPGPLIMAIKSRAFELGLRQRLGRYAGNNQTHARGFVNAQFHRAFHFDGSVLWHKLKSGWRIRECNETAPHTNSFESIGHAKDRFS